MDPILELRNVTYGYNGRQVLVIDSLFFPRGSITGLAGPNGSGKTTLLKLLSGLDKPTAGVIVFRARKDAPAADPLRHRLCLLPQEPYLLKRSVAGNIAYGLRIRGRKGNLDQQINEALRLVGLAKTFAGRQWHELSGGETQRIALAARLVLRPDCLLLDEPTASVDMESARCIRRAVMLARQEWGATLVIASHHRSWLNDICDRIVYLYNGRILDCSYENVLTGPWEAVDGNRVFCRLSDGQRIFAAKPFHAERSAVIPPEVFGVNSAGSRPEAETLQGIITSLNLDKDRQGAQLHVRCGEQSFLVHISSDLLASGLYLPGRTVTLSYNPADLVWLQE